MPTLDERGGGEASKSVRVKTRALYGTKKISSHTRFKTPVAKKRKGYANKCMFEKKSKKSQTETLGEETETKATSKWWMRTTREPL